MLWLIDWCGAPSEPTIFDDHLAKDHEAPGAELFARMSKGGVQIRNHVADVEESSGQRPI
jgi:hypothetical protein